MKAEAVQVKAEEKNLSPLFVETRNLFEEMEKIYKTISERAFDFFKYRGFKHGHELDDWFRAESEMLRPATTEITDIEGNLVIKCEVPGFAIEDLKVSVEPLQVLVQGNFEKKEEKKEEEKVVYTEYRSNQVFRKLALPCEVIPEKATATLKDGMLTIKIPKVVTTEPTKVEIKTE